MSAHEISEKVVLYGSRDGRCATPSGLRISKLNQVLLQA